MFKFYWIKRKCRQVKRVIDFLPIIWKGYDWDFRYALELFQHQLKRTADHIEKDGHLANKENTVSRIRTAVELMEKVYDEEYQFEYATKIEEKYGKSSFEFTDSGEYDERGEPYSEMIEIFEQDYTEEEQQMIADERDSLMWESRAKQEKAHKLLWNYVEHNIQKWWD